MFNVLFWSQVRHWETEKYQNNNKNSFINSDWLFMSICATRAHYQPQNLAENDIKLSNFCQKGTKAPEDGKRIEIDRTDRWFLGISSL